MAMMTVREIEFWLACEKVTERRRGEVPGCKQPPHVKSFLEQENIGPESVAQQYSRAIRRFLGGKWLPDGTHNPEFIEEEEMFLVLSSKHVIKPGCCLLHQGRILLKNGRV